MFFTHAKFLDMLFFVVFSFQHISGKFKSSVITISYILDILETHMKIIMI